MAHFIQYHPIYQRSGVCVCTLTELIKDQLAERISICEQLLTFILHHRWPFLNIHLLKKRKNAWDLFPVLLCRDLWKLSLVQYMYCISEGPCRAQGTVVFLKHRDKPPKIDLWIPFTAGSKNTESLAFGSREWTKRRANVISLLPVWVDQVFWQRVKSKKFKKLKSQFMCYTAIPSKHSEKLLGE